MITPLAVLALAACSSTQSPSEGPSEAQIRAAFEELNYEAVTQVGTPFAGVSSAWQAPNRAHELRTFFLPEGLRVRPRRGAGCGWELALSLAAHGRGANLVAAEPVEPVVDGTFVEYRRGALTEWYFNDAIGLEQGFTLEARVPGTGPLVFVLRLAGDFRAEVADERVALRGPDGAALWLDELCVLDAEGRRLKAHFEPDPLGARIVVHDDGAAYPLTVDPLLVNVGTQLEQPFYVAEQLFGTAVAVHGDSAAVGGPGGDGMTGVVHTWRWAPPFWQGGARIVPPAGEPGDRFGQAVSIVDDATLLVGAPGTDVLGIADAGQAYVYQKTGPLPQDWSHWITLPHPDAATDNGFGAAVALRDDGARLYVGAPQKFSGWAYMYGRSGTSWAEVVTLAPVSGVPAEFGSSISFDKSTSMVLFGGPATDGGKGMVWGFNDSTAPLVQRTFQPADLLPGDRFGESIAHQGNWTVFGAPGQDTGALDGGAAYVWEQITSLVWVPRHKIVGTEVGGALGRAVDVWTETSGDGRIAIGEPGGGPSQEGAVHVYRAAPTVLTLVQQLVRLDGTSGDQHGASVAIHGDLLLAGAPFFDQTLLGPHPSVDSGRACTYSFDGSVWSEEPSLHPPELVIGDRYGQGVALAGDWAAVGASGDDMAATNGGAVFLLERTAPQTWTLRQKLTAGTGAVPGGQFGYTVALQDDELFASHGGVDEVWAYRRQGEVWSLEAQIAGATAPLVPHQFDVSGNRLIVRSEDLIGGMFPRGAATIFHRNGTSWSEAAYLDDPGLPLLNKFGTDYAIEGGVAVVGCSTDDGVGAEAGMARVYVFNGAVWLLESELRPAGLVAGDNFGAAVDLSDGVLAVSATLADVGGARAGVVHTFARSGSSWIQEAQLVSPNPQDLGYFGWSLALDGSLLVVGAPFEDANALVDHGRAYAFQRFTAGWTALEELQGIWFKFGTSVDVSGQLAVGGAPDPAGWAGAYELAPAPALVYCTAKVNSQGCTPGIEFTGSPSASAGTGFDIACIHNRDGVSGTFFYGVNGPKATPYQGGYLCVVGPVKRTGIQNSGGVGNCNGEFHFDFNARIASGADPSLVAGQTVWGQYWSRDAPSSFGSNRSDAIEFVIQP